MGLWGVACAHTSRLFDRVQRPPTPPPPPHTHTHPPPPPQTHTDWASLHNIFFRILKAVTFKSPPPLSPHRPEPNSIRRRRKNLYFTAFMEVHILQLLWLERPLGFIVWSLDRSLPVFIWCLAHSKLCVQTKEGKRGHGAVPLNSVVYLQIVLIFCFLKSTCVYWAWAIRADSVFLLCQSVDGTQVMLGFA